MATKSLFFLVFSAILASGLSTKHAPNKRDISDSQPRILTQNGHMVFQTGTNHNITFRSTNGGFVNIGDENLGTIISLVKDNHVKVMQLQDSAGATTTTQIEQLNQRLTAVESLNDIISSINSALTSLTNRVSELESSTGSTSSSSSESTSVGDLENRVRVLERKVRNLQTTQTSLQQNECANMPCQHGGTCIDAFNSYTCLCEPGWEGSNCERDVNECSTLQGTDKACQNGATCINNLGSFTCTCSANWNGVLCTINHDDCSAGSDEMMCGHGTCHDEPRQRPGMPNYRCDCDPGWTRSSNSPTCNVDVNECEDPRYPCSTMPRVECENTPGSFRCRSCPTGYNGNGYHCSDINECDQNNGGCFPGVTCTNTPGSRSCSSCPPGYIGDGVSCHHIGVCSINNGECSPLATCSSNTAQGYAVAVCTCGVGYAGSGEGPSGCVAVSGPSQNTGACSTNPCVNGRCHVAGNTYMCVCDDGWSGTNCNQATTVSPCASNPCQNGGTCSVTGSSYICTCTNTYTGPTCSRPVQSCGDRLAGDSGSFSFPQAHGQSYPHSVSCAWVITVSPNKIIQLTFTMFKLESHAMCDYDFLQINDGPTAAAHPIGRYCGQELPNGGHINTTHNTVYFWFKSDATDNADGFAVSWNAAEPSCGGLLLGQSHGVITSPGYPGNYPHNRDCRWVVRIEPGNVITFSFGEMSLENHVNCSYDYVKIYDGLRPTSTNELQTLCRSLPPPVTTSGPFAAIKFHSDDSNSDTGFSMNFHSTPAYPGCGGEYTSTSGVIISPNYPNPYHHNGQCLWTITVHQSEVITLNFTNIDLEVHPNCNWDYVEVREGNDEGGTFVGRYCQPQLPPVYTSTTSSLWIKFRSDSSNHGSGFRATWNVVCGGTFTTQTGELRSPYFPDPYPNNRECIYTIEQPAGSIITLTFAIFDVEASSDQTCRYDYLEVRDGLTEESDQIGRYCGSSSPSPITSSTNNLWLKFRTDGSRQNNGFRATYEITEGAVVVDPDPEVPDSGCGGVISGLSGSIHSPTHPSNYPHNSLCTWFLSGIEGTVIQLTFHTFILEGHSSCSYDYVEVFDNNTVHGTSLGKFCGTVMPSPIVSSDRYLTVQFRSDGSVSREGFSASFLALAADLVCGRMMTAPSGIITSPNYPDNYNNNRECEWTIVASGGQQITLNVTNFVMEGSPSCNSEYLEIRNGGSQLSPLIGRYCGTTIDPIIRSHSNRLYLKMKTNSYTTFPGFRIFYDSLQTGCGGELTAPSGSFVSPNFPEHYQRSTECFWMVRVAEGSKIQLTFSHMQMESHSQCRYDYVEIRQRDRNGRVLGKFCGNSIPQPLESEYNIIWVKFRSDGSGQGTGFSATYHANCNNELTAHYGAIESPGFPNPYPSGRDCTWVIRGSRGSTISASFSHFTLEGGSQCAHDYLEIRDGPDDGANQIGKYCGAVQVNPINSTSNTLYLRFVSDGTRGYQGFRMEYITNGCGGQLFAPSGTISSPNYPQQYPPALCDWHIETVPGTRILLNITHVDLDRQPVGCPHSYIQVFGGYDDSAPELTKLCQPSTAAQTVQTTGNYMMVRFNTVGGYHGQGFTARYSTQPMGCGGFYSALSGVIMSQNYPEHYESSTDCIWNITVPEARPIMLTFDDFDVEGSSSCRYDYVEAFDGPDLDYPRLLNRSCGRSSLNVGTLTSSSNHIVVHLRSDHSIQGRGFKAHYNLTCGGLINAEEDGEIVSPGWPSTYESPSNCTWLILAQSPDMKVTLTFTELDIWTNGTGCPSDYVKLYDGDDDTAPQVGTYCGTTLHPQHTSTGSALTVKFGAFGRTLPRAGFRAVYTTSTSSCGMEFTSEHGAFNSPGYPDSYGNDLECVWTVQKAPGNHMLLSFSFFNIEMDQNCNKDFVEVRQGGSGGLLKGRYCGNQIPSNITVVENLWVKFRTNEDVPGLGFMAMYNSVNGGQIEGTTGLIASPRYPRNYPNSIEYEWIIMAPGDALIRLDVVHLDLEGRHPGCPFDYVAIYDGQEEDALELRRFCGNGNIPAIISYSNVVKIIFHTDSSVNGQGFLISWNATGVTLTTPVPSGETPVCGGELNADDSLQVLTSPGYPYGYADNLRCRWLISSPENTRVWVNITHLSLEGGLGYRCSYDRVALIDSTGRNLGTFCGTQSNEAPILSRGNSLIIQFMSDATVNMTGFALGYKSVCGGLYIEAGGRIQSPGYPQAYPTNINCTWTVIVPAGMTINLTFEGFNIQGSEGQCVPGDYVEFINGIDESSPPLTTGVSNTSRHCGSVAPQIPGSSDNSLVITFRSDIHGSAPGFSLTYSQVPYACGGTLSLDDQYRSAVFTSPNYPDPYPHNVDCIWVVTTPVSERIRVDFMDRFEIEGGLQCEVDYVELRDGATIHSPLLGRFCQDLPHTLRSSGHIMFIRFRSDSTIAYQGFKLQYQIDTCGGTIRASSGTIQSPNYPNLYDANTDCEWIIEGPTGHFITLNVNPGSNLQYAQNCEDYDYVQIRDFNSTGPVLSTFCRSSTPTVTTSDNTAHIKFHSDASRNYRGFVMSFNASVEECGGLLTTASGTFTSPNYPGLYAHHRRCHWNIQVAAGRRVSLTFNNLNLELAWLCRYDGVRIYNGILHGSPRLATICGSSIPTQPIESSGNTMAVVFTTDGSISADGFSASYTSNLAAVCGGLYTNANGASGTITSPGFHDNLQYNASTQCLWRIESTDQYNSSISLRFVSIDMEHHGECMYDFVELREDGYLGNDLGKFCSNQSGVMPYVITPASSVWIRFVSDTITHNRGFQLEYQYNRCGGFVTDPQGTIVSPNYPQPYNNSASCAWKISAPEGTRIRLQLESFALEPSNDCVKDYLQIFNGGMKSSPSIGKFCGAAGPPSNFLTQSHEVRLEFVSDSTGNAAGFSISYQFDTSACGGDIHAQSGTITSPNWPERYTGNTECRWTLTLEPGYHALVNWNTPFEFPISSPCASNLDYVALIDVESDGRSRRIGRYCGNQMPGPIQSETNVLKVKFRSNSRNHFNGFSFDYTAGCGATYIGPEGRITSPGHPGQYSNNLNCTYTIIAQQPQDFVVLNFNQDLFAIEEYDVEWWLHQHPNQGLPLDNAGRFMCRYDYLTIYRGNNTDGSIVMPRKCGTTAPDPQVAQGMMTLNFITDATIRDAGWVADFFVSECGGEFTSTDGTIHSPAHPLRYMDNANCSYLITVASDRVVSLKFTQFHLESHSRCQYDYVELFDGPSSSDPPLGRFCGRKSPGTILSTGNIILVNFVTDHNTVGEGFTAVYRSTIGPAQGCGGRLNLTMGTPLQVESPDVDNDGRYEALLECRWIIMAPVNSIVQISFSRFDTSPGSDGSPADTLEVRDGLYLTDPLVGTYSGAEIPPTFTGVGDAMNLMLKTYTANYTGFSATLRAVQSLCGGTYRATATPQTLGLTVRYPSDTNCRWTIDSPDHTTILIRTLSMNIRHLDPDCTDAYVQMGDYQPTAIRLTHHYCGNHSVPIYTSTSSGLRIHLDTGTQLGSSYIFQYSIASCNRTFTEPTGRILSPRFPNAYHVSLNCEMVVEVEQGRSLTLFFNSFNIEQHSDCAYDYLQIVNGTSTDAAVLGTYCSSIVPDPIFTSSNSLLLRFVTDSSVERSGFDITYLSYAGDCGGTLSGTYGMFASPGYPMPLQQNITCTWTIQLPARRNIRLDVIVMDIGNPVTADDCTTDYMEMYESTDVNATPFGRYCGSELPASIIVTQSTMTVVYVSTSANTGTGFLAAYRTAS